MKKHVILAMAVWFFVLAQSFAQIGGYAGTVKPVILSSKPVFEEQFKATDLKNIAKVKSLLFTGFHVAIAEEVNISLRSGGTKATINDAGVNLTFKLKNLDRAMIQSATDELSIYLVEKLKSSGYEFKSYEDYSAIMNKFGIAKLEASNGIPLPKELLIPGASGPSYLWFSANNMPHYLISMKAVKALGQVDKEIDNDASVGLGLTLDFLEYEYYAKLGKVEVSHKPQQYFKSSQLTFSIYPAKLAYIAQKELYGYSFGREFIQEIKEGAEQSVIQNVTWKTYEVFIDNEKFKANFLELGKSYIDVMVDNLNQK